MFGYSHAKLLGKSFINVTILHHVIEDFSHVNCNVVKYETIVGFINVPHTQSFIKVSFTHDKLYKLSVYNTRMTIYQINPRISIHGITIPRVVYDSNLVSSPELVKEMEMYIAGLICANVVRYVSFCFAIR
jgi:hypothetical protein